MLILLLLLFGFASGYNLKTEPTAQFEEPRSIQEDSLFGWALAYFKDDLYVGSPRSLKSGKKDGKIYRCKEGEACKEMSWTKTQIGNESEVWFGATLVADSETLYTCAPRFNQPTDVSSIRRMGSCFKMSSGAPDQFSFLFDFRNTRNFQFGSTQQQLYVGTGIYGFSFAKDANGDLQVGGPQNPQIYQRFYQNQRRNIHLYPGVVVKYRNGEIKFPTRQNSPPYTYPDTVTATDYPNYMMAGYTVGTGLFSDDKRQLITGAPGAKIHRGVVYVCGSCVTSNGFDQEVEGDQIGEGFGMSVLACDITGDGKDDLLVGSPLYAPSNLYYDTGRVHVYTNFWNRNQRRNFQLKNTTKLGVSSFRLVSGAMFGKSLACLGDTDGDRKEEVVVGAPYYTENSDSTGGRGAIFIFKSINTENTLDTEFSQVVYGTEPGFGLSFAVPFYTKSAISFGPPKLRKTELAVSSPLSSKVVTYSFRKVIRFNDRSTEELTCYVQDDLDGTDCRLNIDPQTRELVLQIQPTLSAPTSVADLEVTVEVFITDTIADKENSAKIESTKTIQSGEKSPSTDFRFTFVPTAKWKESLNKNPEQSVKIAYKLSYRIVCGTDCPMFPKLPDRETHREVTDDLIMTFEQKVLSPTLSACRSTQCDCSMDYSIVPSSDRLLYVSGDMNRVELGTLKIRNNGPDLSHSNQVTLNMLSNKTTKALGNNYCTEGGNLRVDCQLPILSPGQSVSIPLAMRATDFVTQDFIYFTIEANSICHQDPESRKLDIEVGREWKISAESSGGRNVRSVVWREGYTQEQKDKLNIIKHQFEIENEGPSVNDEKNVYIFYKDHELLSDPVILLGGDPCEQDGDTNFKLVPPQPSTAYSSNTEWIYCSTRGKCKCKKCKLPQLKPQKPSKPIVLSIERNICLSAAETYPVSTFYVAAGLIVDNDSPGTTDLVIYDFAKESVLKQILNNYDIIMAVIFGLILLVVINVIFKYFDIFNKVRIYKNKKPDELNLAEDIFKEQDADEAVGEGEEGVTLRQRT